MAVDLLVILLLIIANGIFALAEIAVVSARRARLQQRAQKGDAGAAMVLSLVSEPTRFLSTVQVGITLVGILTGAFGGALIAGYLSDILKQIPILAPYSYAVSLSAVVLAITFLTLVIGELLPKRIALSNPETIASLIARPMRFLSTVFSPVVYVLTVSTNILARLFGVRPMKELPVTAEEITILLEQGENAGVFEPTEQDIIENALRLDDIRVSALVTPRLEIIWIDRTDPPETILGTIMNCHYSYFPVANEELDRLEGIVRGRDVLAQRVSGRTENLLSSMRPPIFIPESQSALEILEMFKSSGQHMAMVIDEFGGLTGLVTLTDIIETLVGEIQSTNLPEEHEAVRLEGGAWILDGRLTLHEFTELLDMKELPEEGEGGYDTLGGFVMAMLGRIPARGDSFEYAHRRFEVVQMEGKRVDQVQVTPLEPDQPPDSQDKGNS